MEVHYRADRRNCSRSEKMSGAEQIALRNMSESEKGVMSGRKWSIIVPVFSTGDIWEKYIFYHCTQEQRAV